MTAPPDTGSRDQLLGLVTTWQQRTREAQAARRAAEAERDTARRTQVATIRAAREVVTAAGLWDEFNEALARELGEETGG